MFEGRFHTDKDALFGASWQIQQSTLAPEVARAMAQAFAQRQRKRRAVVGSSDWKTLVRCLREVCSAIQDNVAAGHSFLLGPQPTVADFALFGQMRLIATDPLPAPIVQEYPGAWGWVWRMEDLSGHHSEGAPEMTDGARRMLKLAAQTYLPFLRANAQALEAGRNEVRVAIFGGDATHVQPPFKYQQRCLRDLEAQYAALGGSARAAVDKLLADAGAPPASFQPSHGARL
jgi:hypothetical protein